MDHSGEHRSKYEVMDQITENILGLMEDLYQSGFDTVHDATLKDIQRAAERTGQYGMAYLSGLLTDLCAEISAGRHRMERQTARMTEIYTDINEYLYICRRKTAYDRGLNYYSEILSEG